MRHDAFSAELADDPPVCELGVGDRLLGEEVTPSEVTAHLPEIAEGGD